MVQGVLSSLVREAITAVEQSIDNDVARLFAACERYRASGLLEWPPPDVQNPVLDPVASISETENDGRSAQYDHDWPVEGGLDDVAEDDTAYFDVAEGERRDLVIRIYYGMKNGEYSDILIETEPLQKTGETEPFEYHVISTRDGSSGLQTRILDADQDECTPRELADLYVTSRCCISNPSTENLCALLADAAEIASKSADALPEKLQRIIDETERFNVQKGTVTPVEK